MDMENERKIHKNHGNNINSSRKRPTELQCYAMKSQLKLDQHAYFWTDIFALLKPRLQD